MRVLRSVTFLGDPEPDGSTVFKLEYIDIPEHWTQLAIDILALKYFRKGSRKCIEDGTPVVDAAGQPALGGERDARSGVREGWPVADLLGKNHGHLRRRKTPPPSTMKCATCWPIRWLRPTAPFKVVQHRAALCLRAIGTGRRPLLCRA